MKFLLYKDLVERGVRYSDRQLRRLEERGVFPKRVSLVKGGSLKGWPEIVIDRHIEALAEQ